MKTETRRLAILFFMLLIGAVALTVSVEKEEFQGEENIGRAIQGIDNPAFDGFMKAMTLIASYGFSIIVIVILFVFLWLKSYKLESIFLIVAGLNGILCAGLKVMVQRIRPAAGAAMFLDYSFPSGHVMNLVVFYGFVMYMAWVLGGNSLKKRAMLLSLFALLSVFVGLSRVYLGAHWFTDVIGAYLFGGCYVVALVCLYKRQKAKRKNSMRKLDM